MVARAAHALGPFKRLGTVLVAAAVVRLVILAMTAPLDTRIVDEQQYHVIATNLTEGRGFAGEYGPTSLRPPVYPALVAGIWSVTGSRSLQAVRAFQALLGLATALLVYFVGCRLYDERAGLVAAAVTAFYPPLLFANFLLLTETVFTFLLTAFVATVVILLQRPGPVVALAAGALLGLAALTRSVVWPFPLLLVPLVALTAPTTRARRVACCALLVAGHALVIAPWAIRNTRLQRVPVIVDTIGGMNLRMGNYEFTPHDRIWDAVSLGGAQSWIVGLPSHPPDGGSWTEGWKEKWAREQAVAFMREHPGLTLWRAVIKFSDFWGLDRDFLAGIQRGLFHPPAWAAAIGVVAMTVAYPVVIGLALLGVFISPPADRPSHLVLVALVLFVTALHTVVFGHPRYRLPLMPVLAVYAGAALSAHAWRFRHGWRQSLVLATLGVMLLAMWTTQFVERDWPHVRQLLDGGRS